MRILSTVILMSLGGAAQADCAAGLEQFMSCTFQNGRKAVEVCASSKTASYMFGPTGGAPELALSVPVSDLDYTPWPGVGSNIWEEIVFTNNGVKYSVYVSRTRPVSDDIAIERFGGIEVIENGQTLAELSCDKGSVSFPWTDVLGG